MEALLLFCLALLGFIAAQSPPPAIVYIGGSGHSTLGQTNYVVVTLSCTPTVSIEVSPSFQTGKINVAPTGSQYLVPTATWPLGTHNLTIIYPGDSSCNMGYTKVKWSIVPPCTWFIYNPYAELNNSVSNSAPGILGWTTWASLCPDGTLEWWSLGSGGFPTSVRAEGRGDPLWQELNFGTGCGFAPTSMPNLPTSPAFISPDSSCPNTCQVSVTWNATTPIGGYTTLNWTGYVGLDNYTILWMSISPGSLSRLQASNNDVKNYFGRLGISPLYAPDLPTNIASPGVTTINGSCQTVTTCVGGTGDCPDNLASCPSTTIGITACPSTPVGGKCAFACSPGNVYSGASYATCKFGGVWSYGSCRLGHLQLTTSHGDFFQSAGDSRTFQIGLPCGHPTRNIVVTRTEVQTGIAYGSTVSLTSYDGGLTTSGNFTLGALPAGLHQFQITYPGADLSCPYTTATQYYFVAPPCAIRVQANATLAYGTFDYGNFKVGGNVWEFIGTQCQDGIGIQWQAFYDPSQTQAQIWARDQFIGQYVLQSQLFGKCGVAPYLFPTLPTVFSQWHQAYNASSCPVCLVNVTWAVTTAIRGMSGTLNFQGGLCADNYHISWNEIVGTQTLFRGLLSPTEQTAYLGGCGVAPTNAPDLPTNISDVNVQLVSSCPSIPSPLPVACASHVVALTTCPSGSLGDICYYQCPTSQTPAGVGYVFCQKDGNWSAPSCIATTSQVSTTINSHVAALCAGGGEMIEYVGVLCYERGPFAIRWDSMDDITNPGGGCHWHRDNYVSNPSWLTSWVGDCGVSPTSVLPYPPSPTALAPEVYYYAQTSTTHSLSSVCGSETTSSSYTYSGILCNALGDIVWNAFYIPNNQSCREDREVTTLNISRWFGSCGVAPLEFSSLPTRVTPSGYLGCYTDTPTRVMSGPTTGGITIQGCANTCASAGTLYFGLEDGNECWCGNQYATYGQSTGCGTYSCSGDSTGKTTCGGPWAMAIYETFTTRSAVTLSSSLSPDPTGYRPIPTNLEVTPEITSLQLSSVAGCPLVFEYINSNDNGFELPYFPLPPNGPWELVMDMWIDNDGELVATGPCDTVTDISGWAMYRSSGNLVLQFNRGHPAIQSAYVWNTGIALQDTNFEPARHLITLDYDGTDMLVTVDGASAILNSLAAKNISVASSYRLRLMRSGCLVGSEAGLMRSFRAYACITCGSYSPPSGYSLNGSCSGTRYPTQCQFTCNSPNHLIGGNSVFCGANSQWTYTGKCAAGCAPDLTTGAHAAPFGCDAQIAEGATCDNECLIGYSLSSGSLTRTCSGGSLSAISYTCSVTTCSYSSTRPAHSHVVSGCTTSDAYLSNCVLACDTGYYLTAGSAILTCTSPGAQSYTAVCSPITCADTNTLPTGTVVVSGCTMADAYNSLCTLACATGYYYTGGSYSRTCNLAATGSYPASNLVCPAITCSYSLTLPVHSHVVSGCTTSDAYNANCVLACDTGFYLTAGSASLTCTSPGSHAYTAVCSPITCAESNTLPVGAIIVSGCTMADAYNTNCTLACDNGYSYTSGSYSRTCNLAASGSYPASNLVCTAFTPKNVTGSYTNGYNIQLNGIAVLVILPDGATNYYGTFTDLATHLSLLVNGVTQKGNVTVDGSDNVINITWTGNLGNWTKGAPVPQPYTYPAPLTTVPDGDHCFAPGFVNVYPFTFCTSPDSCYFRRNTNLWEFQRGVCGHQCNVSTCSSLSGLNVRGVDKYCNKTAGGSFTCVNYAPLNGTCGGYNLTTLAPQPPYCDWKSVCLNQTGSWKCANSTCLNSCRYGTYCYTTTTTSDTAICGGYEVPAFDPTQFSTYLDIYAGYEPGDPLQSRKELFSQVGAFLLGPLPCTPGTSDCGMSATCAFDTRYSAYYCTSIGVNPGTIPIPTS